MIIPIRCFSCGKPVAQHWKTYEEKAAKKNADTKKLLDEAGLERYCCRSVFLGQKNVVELVSKFKKY